MKNFLILFLLFFCCINVNSTQNDPKYKIIANSNSQEDIEEMYNIKKQLLLDYKDWCKSVDDTTQVLYDHQYVYNAIYENNVFLIRLGNAEGKELSGTLKINYCESTTEIKKKSFIYEFFFK